MKTQYAKSDDTKRINKLIEYGYKLYKAYKVKNGDIWEVELVFVKE